MATGVKIVSGGRKRLHARSNQREWIQPCEHFSPERLGHKVLCRSNISVLKHTCMFNQEVNVLYRIIFERKFGCFVVRERVRPQVSMYFRMETATPMVRTQS